VIFLKVVFIIYAFISIAIQVGIGKITGFSQGSIGLLIFIFLVEIDSRFSFQYMIPNMKKMKAERNNGGNEI
jgi:hypothetical protein